MRIDVLTLFPNMLEPLNTSILGRAQQANAISINAVNIRDYSQDKHLKCDDYSFGGGEGMVMTPQPIYSALNAVDPNRTALRIYMSPKGKVLDQEIVKRLAQNDRLVILCGHYEGVDQRIIDRHIDEEISIGDFVLTGGELAAMVLIDAVSRHIEGVLGCNQSAHEESFCDGLLEYPHYTRPQDFMGDLVPEVLLSGHHENIKKWRKQQSLLITQKNRPDLLEKK